MDLPEYQQIVAFLFSSIYPDDLKDTSTKAAKNRRDNFKAKTKKFYLQGEELYRYVPGNINGAKVVLKEEVNAILKEFHGSTFGGHSGVNKTREAIKSRYWWFGLTDDIKNYISSCEACQKSDPLKPAKKPELQQIKVSRPFELVGVDLVGPLTETDQGNKYIFTATDYFTKWVEAFPIPSKTAQEVSKCFEKLFSRHGAVNAILTDQGREFVNQVNDQLCKDWNVQHRITAAYHPQTNGLDEKTNQTLKTTLRKLVNEHQTDWDKYIDGALFSQRTKPHSSTKHSPFFLLYGREAVYPSQLPKTFTSDTEPPQPNEEDVQNYIKKRQEISKTTAETVTTNIEKAHQKQQKDYKTRVMKSRKFTSFKVGDLVLVHNRSSNPKKKGALLPNYSGPYTIEDIEGKKVTLKNKSDVLLKSKASIDHLKIYNQPANQTDLFNQDELDTCLPILVTSSNEEVKKQQIANEPRTITQDPGLAPVCQYYVEELVSSGQMKHLIDFVMECNLTDIRNVSHLQSLLEHCPIQSFIKEVSRVAEDEMDVFAGVILPCVRHLDISLPLKITLTMILSCLCVRASALFQPAVVIAETLKDRPGHLMETIDSTPLHQNERLSAGGEVIEANDLKTLENPNWLNDKVINAYLGVLRMEQNNTDLHIFVLPSYTAVLWENGSFEQWMFKKVQFSMYRHVLMPINSNGNHWVLMVVDMVEQTVCILDSMHGQATDKWIGLWRKFIDRRNAMPEIVEKLGPFQSKHSTSSKQSDSCSCGVFTLMNAECISKGVPVSVMRQVHCLSYREYIMKRLLMCGTTKQESYCDMPGCAIKSKMQRWVQCGVCGRWMHTKCCGIPVKAAIEDEFVCCICKAMYT